MRVHVLGVGIAAPGLPDWLTARAVLSGQAPYAPGELSPASPAFLPPNERRRVSRTIRLALQVAQEAMQAAPFPAARVSPVFASAWGDLEIADRILTALALPDRAVSPTHFHNSVHNAAAGYWTIGSGSSAPASAIAAGAGTFAAGLLEAATLAATDSAPALLVAYDWTPPPALAGVVDIAQPFAAALLLAPEGSAGAAAADLTLHPPGADEALADATLERLRRANPIGAALPLLRALALGGGRASLPYPGTGVLRVEVSGAV